MSLDSLRAWIPYEPGFLMILQATKRIANIHFVHKTHHFSVHSAFRIVQAFPVKHTADFTPFSQPIFALFYKYAVTFCRRAVRRNLL